MVDITKKPETFEFEIQEIRTYIVQGDGRTAFEAQQDAIARYYRLGKSGELVAHEVGRPRITKQLGKMPIKE